MLNTINNRPLKEYFIKQLAENIEGVAINGHPIQRLQNIISVSFECVNYESVITALDLQGIAVSNGSACEAGDLTPSHVLKAIGLDDVTARSTIRFSLSKFMTKADIDYTIEKLSKVIDNLRSISPVKRKKKEDK